MTVSGPGDSFYLDVTVEGGSGSYTYAWSSDPPGFSSDQKDPWVFPTESGTYFLQLLDNKKQIMRKMIKSN